MYKNTQILSLESDNNNNSPLLSVLNNNLNFTAQVRIKLIICRL